MSSLNAPLSLASSSLPLHAFSGLTKAVVLNYPFLCNSSHCDNSIYWHVSEVLPFFLRNLMVHFNVPSLSSEHRRSKWQITKSGCKRLEGRLGGWVGAHCPLGNLQHVAWFPWGAFKDLNGPFFRLPWGHWGEQRRSSQFFDRQRGLCQRKKQLRQKTVETAPTLIIYSIQSDKNMM